MSAAINPYEDPHHMNSAILDVDDLPPPPPEMIPQPPPPQEMIYLTSSLKKPAPPTPVRKPTNTKRISFDDDVQVIGVSHNVNKQLTPPPPPLPQPQILENDSRKILSFSRQPYNASPKKLFTEESNCQAAPPKAFLQDLQRVMTKKWQVAEKCRTDGASVHHVYGFR